MTDDDARALGEKCAKALARTCPTGALGMWQQDGETPWPQRVTETDPGPDGCRLVWIDMRDAPTRGAVLEVVRERWGDPCAHLRLDLTSADTRWRFWSSEKWRIEGPSPSGPTEAAALVAALEAAPR